MDKQDIANTLEQLKNNSPKKNFKQSIDLFINLKDIDLKKTDQQINIFVSLHYPTGKKISICAITGPELEPSAREACDEVIIEEDFVKFKDKKQMKKLADKHTFFIAQASVMPKIATTFGRVFGPRGKMPNPKLGSVLPPNANVSVLTEKLKKTVQLVTKNEPTVKCMVGKEDSKTEEVIDNILTIYNAVIHKLPHEKHNVKNMVIKYTMGPGFKIGEVIEEEADDKKGHGKKKKQSKAKESKQDAPAAESPEKKAEEKKEEKQAAEKKPAKKASAKKPKAEE